MTTTKGPPDISEQAVTPARPAPPPMEKGGVLIGLVVAAIGLIVAVIGLGAMASSTSTAELMPRGLNRERLLVRKGLS